MGPIRNPRLRESGLRVTLSYLMEGGDENLEIKFMWPFAVTIEKVIHDSKNPEYQINNLFPIFNKFIPKLINLLQFLAQITKLIINKCT
jgi:hypothetical protein